jgi:hypothetical protein
MKKAMILAGLLVLAAPSFVYSDSFILRMGYFMPKALTNSSFNEYPDSLWTYELQQMSFRKNDYRGPMYGVGYEYFLTKQFSLVLSVDFYRRSFRGFYLDWVGYAFDEGDFAFPYELYEGEFGVFHSYRVSITPLQLSVKVAPLGRRSRFVPYIGGGVGLYFWRASLYGEIVDFADPYIYDDPDLGEIDVYPIVPADLRETGRVTVGYHAFGGIQIPIGYRITLDAEARYNIALGKFREGPEAVFEDFDPFDLGGLVLSGGISIWF